jgi:hypothetical protein
MRELFKSSLVVPALILAEVALPFSFMLAKTVPWRDSYPDVEVAVSVALGLVLVMYVVFEAVRHASLLAGALVGLWAAIVGTWPSFVIESVTRNSMMMSWSGQRAWAGLLDMVPRMLEYAGIGLALGLVVSLIPWLVHRREARPAVREPGPPATGVLRVVTVVFAFVPLLAALGVSRRVDWLLHQYVIGEFWSTAARTLFNTELIGRIVLLIAAVVATGLFLMRKPAARKATVILLGLALAVVLFRLGSSARIPLSGSAGWRQFQSALDIFDAGSAVLAAVLGIPYFLRSRQVRTATARNRMPQ